MFGAEWTKIKTMDIERCLCSCRESNDVMVAVEFVLQNFTEMNKLWVRLQLQHQVHWTSLTLF